MTGYGTGLLVPAASSWEIAIKYRLGRLDLPEPPDRYVPSRLRAGVSAGGAGWLSVSR